MAGVDWISVWETAGGSRSAQSDLAHWQGQHPKRGTAKQQIELFGLLDPFDLLALSVFLVVALEELPFFFGGFWPPLADLEDHLAGTENRPFPVLSRIRIRMKCRIYSEKSIYEREQSDSLHEWVARSTALQKEGYSRSLGIASLGLQRDTWTF